MTDRQDHQDHHTFEHSTVEEEARRLMESLGAWASGTAGQRPGQAAGSTADCTCEAGPKVCRVCPICRIGAVVESLSPELVERIADLVAMVAGSLTVIAQDRRAARADDPPTGEEQQPRRHHVPKDERAFGADEEGDRRS